MSQERMRDQKKRESVAYALAHPEIPTKKLAGDLGIGYSTLDNWLRQTRGNSAAGSTRTLSAEQQRIKQLEKEVAHLREVNDIIMAQGHVEKAHVYFVTHPSR